MLTGVKRPLKCDEKANNRVEFTVQRRYKSAVTNATVSEAGSCRRHWPVRRPLLTLSRGDSLRRRRMRFFTVVFAAIEAASRMTRSFIGRARVGVLRQGGTSPLSTSISWEAL